MKKLVCRYCGNKEFYVVAVNETLCKCGLLLTKRSDFRLENDHNKWKEIYQMGYMLEADTISKISLLKQEIDKCLDERDQARFQKLTEELKACHKLLLQPWTTPKERFKENGKSLT